ncbi:MAG: PIN domain-containing protein [candidate division KSB1 bacterium]|nr:PIN domain-containing protein [candidate division KSB1 bacterium]MDZ7274603.1 PIN domain-containing protein [candidate division KSB1 bacterium]MDZ7284736.1 PIN domain-containing protein [candidate division KSB1 bacterium]MDZ7297844.1 PIN domain-containing protein [candidate division KSB1 bacterium]MDZ7308763.1 PIN domain-containing protein [candidate division KSB1 bacterium]
MIKLDAALVGVKNLGLDTAPVIYFIEKHRKYDALVTEIFQRIDRGALVGITSVVTFTEVLLQPVKKGDTRLQQEYSELLLNSAHFDTIPIDAGISQRAAILRAAYNLRTPDALQIATALEFNCQAFLTNDKQLKRVTELQVLVLDELEL